MDEAKKQALKDLKATASQSVFYVADGKTMRRELVKKFNITENDAELIIRKTAAYIHEVIMNIGT